VVKPLDKGLDKSAVETVRTWKFKPGTRNGVPIPIKVMVEITFRL
jgi:TonB family protein